MSFTLRAKRMLVTAAAGALVLSLFPAATAFADIDDVCENAPDAGFSDAGTTHADNIDCMTAYGIGQGYGDGLYGTFDPLTRGQAATLFVKFAMVATDGAIADEVDEDIEVPFTDMGTTHDENIEILYRLGLISGTTETTYSPNAPITRAQYATILFNAHAALGVDFDASYTTNFTDIEGSIHAEAIAALEGEGIIDGTTPTTYEPAGFILRGQNASLLAASAGLLDELELWLADRLPAPTNQTFTVTPADLGLAGVDDPADTQDAEDTDREYTVTGLGDVDEVVIGGADPADVTMDSGTVSFDGIDSADLDGQTNVALSSVVVDGTTFTGVDFGTAIDVDGVDAISFTIASASTVSVAAQTVPVVYVQDADDDLAIDADGEPTVDFGVGGEAYFVDPHLTVDDNADPVTGVEGGSVDVVVQVEEDVAGDDLEVAGIPIDVIVTDGDFVTYDLVTNVGTLVEDTVVTDADGLATFEVDDVADGAALEVHFKWTGTDSLEGLDALSEDEGVDVTWEESDGLLTTDSLDAEVAASYLGVGMTATVDAEVTDKAGEPIADTVVQFSVDRSVGSDFSTTRTTDANGEASYSYTKSGDADVDEITVSVIEAPDGETPSDSVDHGEPTAVTGLEVGWFVEADDADNFGATADESRILSANAALEVLFVADGATPTLDSLHTAGATDIATMEWVGYTDANLYFEDGGSVTFAGFVDALFTDDVYDFANEGVASFESENRDDRDATVRYNLNSDSTGANSLFAGDPAGVALSAAPTSIETDSAAGSSTITATVTDVFGDDVPDGTDVTFTVSNDPGTTGASFAEAMPVTTTGGDATATLEVAADQSGTVTITVDSGTASNTIDVVVDTTADPA